MPSKKKILIVDDEPDLVEWLSVFFEENGFEAICAYDGKEGFAKAEKDTPDLITLDISMPKESGVKMYRNLMNSKTSSNIPIIILTGAPPDFKNFVDKVKTFPKPAGYFEKPVDREKLLEKVKELT